MNNKTYKYETHLHTKEGSACGQSTGVEMVHAHAAAGYAGFIVTDHFFNGNCAVPSDLPWEDRVMQFIKGYENSLEEGKKIGFHVFLGWEYGYSGTDFLTYGLDEKFLLAHPDLLEWSIEKYFDIVHQNGGLISHAHPFREAPYIHEIRLFPEYEDAVEVINANHKKPIYNEKALIYAKEHSKIQMSGSDAHRAEDLHGGGMEFDCEITSMVAFLNAVRRNEHRLLEGRCIN